MSFSSAVATSLYKGIVAARSARGRWIRTSGYPLEFVRRAWIRVQDPLVSLEIHGRPIIMPFSHDLGTNVATNPHYNSIFPRLARHLVERDGKLTMIDVGANIGDTAALCADSPSARFLCIEADSKFGDLILKNVPDGETRVTWVHCLCGEADGTLAVAGDRNEGTVVFRAKEGDAGEDAIPVRSIDSLVLENPEFAEANIIKIDCDGHDFRILRGAEKLLRRQPALIFEAAPCGAPDYIQAALDAVARLGHLGYQNIFLYDNLGHPFGLLSTADERGLRQALEYQAVSRRLYFDILAMRADALDEFIARERHGFLELCDEGVVSRMDEQTGDAIHSGGAGR